MLRILLFTSFCAISRSHATDCRSIGQCSTSNTSASMEKVMEQEQREVGAARFELLQSRVIAQSTTGADSGTTSVGPASQIRECPRVDARSLTPEALRSLKEPTVLEHAWDVLDSTTWARSDFEQQGPFGDIPMNALNMFRIDVKAHRMDENAIQITLAEALDYPQSEAFYVYYPEAQPIIGSLSRKNGGVPLNGTLANLLAGTNFFAVTLENQRQWARMHTHSGAVFIQVTGRKGWVFGDSSAWVHQQLMDEGAGGGPVPDHLLSREDTCDLFFKAALPKSLAEKPASFRKCETRSGEALAWPSLCGGECGWWHGTCGLESFNTGMAYTGLN